MGVGGGGEWGEGRDLGVLVGSWKVNVGESDFGESLWGSKDDTGGVCWVLEGEWRCLGGGRCVLGRSEGI